MTDISNRKNQINDAFKPNYATIEIMKDYLQKNCPEFYKNFELLNYIKTDTTSILYKVKAKNIRNKQYYFFKFCEQKNGPYKYIQEIILHKKLHHNNISKLFGIYKVKDNNNFFTLSEFAKYGNLNDFLIKFLKRPILSESFINFFSKPILEALNYLRRNKLIHTNIKKGNIVINSELKPKIIDFSNVFSYEGYKPDDIIKLPLIGTGRYMAPEILNEKEFEIKYGDKIDIYSFGVILYNLAFGHYPYDLNNVQGDDFKNIKEKLNEENLVFPNNYKISKMFINFLKNVLEKDYKKRYNIKEALEDPWIKGWDIINEEKENIVIEENFVNFFVKLSTDTIPEFNEYINNNNC